MRALTTCKTSEVLWLCFTLYSAFSMECLAFGCTVTEPSHTVSCSVVAAARLCEIVVLGIRDTRVDSKIQIKYIDIKNSFADIRTKGNFIRRMETSFAFL